MPAGDSSEIGGYRTIRLLGSGGMGEVYLVTHPRLPRKDALKLLGTAVSGDEEFRSRFQREADLLAPLRHPNIITVYDRGEHAGRLWLTMEYIDGQDAAKLLRTQGRVPLDVVAQIVAGAGAALDYAWSEHDITHRDVKPANILLEFRHDWRLKSVKLADFGIAKAVGETTSLTSAGIAVGTMTYISPEAIAGKPLDNRADIYSLGCTAFELLTGSPPFHGSTLPALMHAHLNAPVPSITALNPGLPQHLNAVFTKVLAKNPDARYQSGEAFAAALNADAPTQVQNEPPPDAWTQQPAHQQGFVGANPYPPPAPTQQAMSVPQALPPSRSKGPMIAALVAVGAIVLAGLVGGGIYLARHGQNKADPQPSTSAQPTASPDMLTMASTIHVGKEPTGIVVSPDGGTAYVTNRSDDTMSVIDMASHQVTTVNVGKEPTGITVSPNGATVYVTDSQISVIDTATKKVTTTIPTGKWPWGVVTSPDGTTAYVTNRGDNNMAVINAATNQVTATVPVGASPGGIAVSPDGATVYVTNYDDNTVSVINTATNQVTATIPAGDVPMRVAVSPDSKTVYITADDVAVVDATTNQVTATIPTGTEPRDIAVSPDGKSAYVTNTGDNNIAIIDTASKRVSTTVATGNRPTEVALSPDGSTVYVTNDGDNTVSIIALT